MKRHVSIALCFLLLAASQVAANGKDWSTVPLELYPLHLLNKYQLVVKFTDPTPLTEAADLVASSAGYPRSLLPLLSSRIDRGGCGGALWSTHTPSDHLFQVEIKDLASMQIMRLIEELQSSSEVEYAYLRPWPRSGFYPGDIVPTTDFLEPQQYYLDSNPGLGFREAWETGLSGSGVVVRDVEGNWNLSHEDLASADAAIEVVPFPLVQGNGLEHGTSVLGVLAADVDEWGISGVSTNSQFHLHPIEINTNGADFDSALGRAFCEASPGDVVLLELQAPSMSDPDCVLDEGGECDYLPLSFDFSRFEMIRDATDAGIVVVEPAGNSGLDLDSPEFEVFRALGDSGAIMVGAGAATIEHERLNFSNFGSPVDIQSWGEGVATLGWSSNPNVVNIDFGGDFDQRYTFGFGGTSAASALVAGAAALIQEAAVRCSGQAFSSRDVRELLKITGQNSTDAASIGEAANVAGAVKNINDSIRHACSIQGSSGTAAGSNILATTEVAEPLHADVVGSGSVWWEWTAPWSGQVTFDTSGSTFDTILAVYLGDTPGTLIEVVSASNSPNPASVTFEAVGGITYKIAVDGPMVNGVGDIELNWNLSLGTADLEIGLTVWPNPVLIGEDLTLTSRISNLGPASATGVLIFQDFGSTFEIVSASITPDGECSNSNGTVICEVLSLFPDNSADVEIQALPTSQGTFILESNVSTLENEPFPAFNNTANEQIVVLDDSSFRVSIDPLRNPVTIEDEVTWLVGISNISDQSVEGVMLSLSLPTGLIFMGANPEICTEEKGIVECDVGIVPKETENFVLEIYTEPRTESQIILAIIATGTLKDSQPVVSESQGSIMVQELSFPSSQKLLPTGNATGALFGISVAIDATTIVVGARESRFDGIPTGSAHVFELANGLWTETQRLIGTDSAHFDFFGEAVAIDKNTIAVGAIGDDDLGAGSGAVYIFSLTGDGWTQEVKIVPEDLSSGDFFGARLAIEDDLLIVGTPDDAGGYGSVYIYERSLEGWELLQKLIPTITQRGRFGKAIAISGDLILVGAPDALAHGAVVVFIREGGQWAEHQTIIHSGLNSTLADFGRSVAVDEDKEFLFIGAGEDTITLGGNVGAVFRYKKNADYWYRDQEILSVASEQNDLFGISIGMGAETIVVGAPGEEVGGETGTLTALFPFENEDWGGAFRLTRGSGEGNNQRFGNVVAVSGRSVVTGAEWDDSNGPFAGSAYVYDLVQLTPTPQVLEVFGEGAVFAGDTVDISWSTSHIYPSEGMVLSMKRDGVSSDVVEPDQINWFRFTENTPNDGSETVVIPEGVAIADDWRFYVRHIQSGAFDATDSTFSVLDPSIDIQLDLEDSPDPVVIGEQLNYSVGVSNAGPNDATDIQVSVVLPSQVIYNSTSHPDICSESGGTVTCSLGNLLNGESFSTIEMVVTADSSGHLVASGQANATEVDSNVSNNSAQVLTEAVFPSDLIFVDGFESGSMSAWSQ